MTDKLNSVLASISASGGFDSGLAASLIAEPTVQDIEAQEVSTPVAEVCTVLGIKYTDDISVLAQAMLNYFDSVQPHKDPYVDEDKVNAYVVEYKSALSELNSISLRMMYLDPRYFNGSPEQNVALAAVLIERAGSTPLWEDIISNGGRYVQPV